MGDIDCPVHGRRGLALVCAHLREAALGERPLPKRTAVTVHDDDEGEDEGAIFELWFCPACISERQLPLRVGLAEWEQQGERFAAGPLCQACLTDASTRPPA